MVDILQGFQLYSLRVTVADICIYQSINQSISQSISMNLLRRPTSKALGRQKYNERTAASQCHNNDSAKRWVLSLVKKSVYVDEVRMCEGRRFQADGAATEKELFESWRLDRGTIKSPRDVDRSRMSEHGWQSSVKYIGADPWTTRYINQWDNWVHSTAQRPCTHVYTQLS